MSNGEAGKTAVAKNADTEASKSQWAEIEETILATWDEADIFAKTLEKTKGGEPFVFYEGPPTANGKPGIHHLEARAFKDAIPRFQTMRGKYVRRRAGWDTHGLPVELQVEKALGFTSKKDIEEYGIAPFNAACKESVLQYVDIWQRFTKRIGYWVNLEEAYWTFNPSYMESLWNVVAVAEERGLLYKDYKVVPWCPRCGTALSSHELAQGYQDVKDISVTAAFKSTSRENTYYLAWTTTPWTLPGNVGLAVGEKISYRQVSVKNINGEIPSTLKVQVDSTYIYAKDLEQNIFGATLGVLEGAKFGEKIFNYPNGASILVHEKEVLYGKDLIGETYEPLYPYLIELISGEAKDNLPNAYKIYGADFVTTEDGTGIVHTAVMYGQDDFELGTKVGLPKWHLVDETGRFVAGTDWLTGRFVKDEDVAVDIIKDLASRGQLFAKSKYEHTYPHCWRCKTPLIYYARDSWYIRMSEIKDTLIKENQEINWEPKHIRDGRFGEWLADLKDWAISRERYWATPLPVWEANDGSGKRLVVGSLETLQAKVKQSVNRYFLMRHGQAESNLDNMVSAKGAKGKHPLTPTGVKEVSATAQTLINAGVKPDLIIHSPIWRTDQTAKLVADLLDVPSGQVLAEPALSEFNPGDQFEQRTWDSYYEARGENWALDFKFDDGESWLELKQRAGKVLKALEEKYAGKTILLVSHSIVLESLVVAAQASQVNLADVKATFAETGSLFELAYKPLPMNERFELDLHRPFIDDIVLEEDGVEYRRVKEVMDVWFDSGAMPFAEDHYPFENKDFVDGPGFPGDYISEAIDQTRGWFYTLHAIGGIMKNSKAFKNVICLGHLLDAEGKKMSKSLGNIVDPWEMIEKYGVDTLRLWMYSVNQPGDSKNFDEKTVGDLNRKVFGLLHNVLAFYELSYEGKEAPRATNRSEDVLDQWLLARLYEYTKLTTESLEGYDLFTAARALREFVADLSQWYVRRSRERLRESAEAAGTLRYVLRELALVIAPLAPFYAEYLYRRVCEENDPESVHLCDWPEVKEVDTALLAEMQRLREVVSRALMERAKAGIKVRQPLATVWFGGADFTLPGAFEVLKAELNVEAAGYKAELAADEIELDTTLTPELLEKGFAREVVRTIQSLRKEAGVELGDLVEVEVYAAGESKASLEKNEIAHYITGATDSRLNFSEAEIEGSAVVHDQYQAQVRLA